MKAILHQWDNVPRLKSEWESMVAKKHFIMKVMYVKLHTTDLVSVNWRKLFSGNVESPHALMVLWLVRNGRLSTKDKICRFGMMAIDKCCYYDKSDTLDHIYFYLFYVENYMV